VRAEAGDGLERDILVSISIEQELKLPLRFRNVHTDLLLDLAVDRSPSVFNKIVEDIVAIIGRVKPESVSTKTAGKHQRGERRPKEKDASELKKVTNTIGMEFVLIPAGSFKMGGDLDDDEKPIYQVVLSHPFYLQTTPVTQGQCQRVMGKNPSDFKDCGDSCPVEMVSWLMVQQFIGKLNEKEGSDDYRLPSEAEWEYACRAGTTTEFSFGDDASELVKYAWFYENSDDMTHSVGSKKPNAFGLYDMHGNVWEWVEDDWHDSYDKAPDDGRAWIDEPRGTYRVMRGGGWYNVARDCRSAARGNNHPGYRYAGLGFRLARSITLGP
jgi:formylglycine-generating enzyme required for sulfatase activity